MSSGVSDPSAIEAGRAAVLDELRTACRTILVTHEHPDGDALGSLIAMQHVLRAVGRDSLTFIAEKRPAAAVRVPLPAAGWPRYGATIGPRPPHDRIPGLRQHRAQTPARNAYVRPQAGAGSSTSTTTRQHALRQRQLRRSGRLVHGRDGLGARARARRRADARDRRRAVCRADHRHRRFMYENTGPRRTRWRPS